MRVPAAPIDGPDADADAVARITQLRGRVGNLFRSLLHSGPVAAGWCELGTAVRHGSSLDDRLRELVICQVVQMTDTSYEWGVHAALAAEAGVTDHQLAALPGWQDVDTFTTREVAALALTEAIVNHSAGDREFDDVQAHFSMAEIVELTVTASYYVAVSRVMQVFGFEADG